MANRYFADEEEAVHPTARAWLERIRKGQKATLTLWRKRDGLTFKPAKLYMTFETSSEPVREHDDWDVDLNEALVRAGVRAEDTANEALRLSLMLRYWFSKPEERFGPGFFEAVLSEILREPDFSNQTKLASILSQIHVNPPSRDGRGYLDCKETVESIIKRAASSLVQHLKYSMDDAESILAEALARYLDERFHVTERRMLGWS